MRCLHLVPRDLSVEVVVDRVMRLGATTPD